VKYFMNFCCKECEKRLYQTSWNKEKKTWNSFVSRNPTKCSNCGKYNWVMFCLSKIVQIDAEGVERELTREEWQKVLEAFL
jgi:hypothetical protein